MKFQLETLDRAEVRNFIICAGNFTMLRCSYFLACEKLLNAHKRKMRLFKIINTKSYTRVFTRSLKCMRLFLFFFFGITSFRSCRRLWQISSSWNNSSCRKSNIILREITPTRRISRICEKIEEKKTRRKTIVPARPVTTSPLGQKEISRKHKKGFVVTIKVLWLN